GGEILDTVLTQLAMRARIIICGAISQYNNTAPVRGPSHYMSLLVNRATMTGMVVFDWADRYGEAAREMAGWMKAGKLKTYEDVENGLENFPEILLKLCGAGWCCSDERNRRGAASGQVKMSGENASHPRFALTPLMEARRNADARR